MIYIYIFIQSLKYLIYNNKNYYKIKLLKKENKYCKICKYL